MINEFNKLILIQIFFDLQILFERYGILTG